MPHDDASLSTADPDLTDGERRVLDRVFQHPLSHNLSWREVVELFKAAGQVEHAHNGNLVLRLGTDDLSFKMTSDKNLSTDEVMALRHFLSLAGWTLGTTPAKPLPSADGAVAVVIDHASARIYNLPLDDARHAPHETHHLHHSIDRTDHDADREESWPVDTRYFDAVAAALSGDGQIVVVGHGKGQSNEADHLMAYLFKHHSAVHARVAREIVADLPHMTVPQLLALARHALQPVLKPAAPDAG
jgi:hypothetical protein